MERRAVIVAGFGFRSGAELPSLLAALALAQRGRPRVTHLSTAADKLPALEMLAEVLGLPLSGVSAQQLADTLVFTTSARSKAARNTGSVAEASALAAAGPGARLLATRHISGDRMATCAIAEGPLT